MADIERIIRPIVEGQIRSFLNDHPEIVSGCSRHVFVNKTPEAWIKDSLSKRITNDLTCGNTTARLAEALLALSTGAHGNGSGGTDSASPPAGVARSIAPAVSASKAIGGHARAAALSPERRREIAQNAATARWGPAAAKRVEEAVRQLEGLA